MRPDLVQINRDSAWVQLRSGGRWGRFDGSRRKRKRQFFNDLQTGTPDKLGNDGAVKASSVVLDSDGVRVAIEGETPDSVYLARVGQSEADRLGGRCGITENDVYGGHRQRIAA
jgi:hypothetical protein